MRMIGATAPLRIPLAGGGTDLPSYASRHGGRLLSVAILREVRVFLDPTRPPPEDPFLAACCRRANWTGGVQVRSNIPPGSGLGGSGATAVALLAAARSARWEFWGQKAERIELAQEAFLVESADLGRCVGPHDQYLAALGGLVLLSIDRQGSVTVRQQPFGPLQEIEPHLRLFHTRIRRDAHAVLACQAEATTRGDQATVAGLHRIKALVSETLRAIAAGCPRRLGEIFNAHWQIKRQLSESVTTERIDALLQLGLSHGAFGGKLVGAGGGGCLLFAAPEDPAELMQAMRQEGLREIPVRFAFQGVQPVRSK